MSTKHFLFPDNNPPPFPNGADVQTVCIWLLAVMDQDDASRKFTASILTQHIERGWLSEKQIDALHSVSGRAVKKYMDGVLMCQGAMPSKSQAIELGNVVPMFKTGYGENCEVIE